MWGSRGGAAESDGSQVTLSCLPACMKCLAKTKHTVPWQSGMEMMHSVDVCRWYTVAAFGIVIVIECSWMAGSYVKVMLWGLLLRVSLPPSPSLTLAPMTPLKHMHTCTHTHTHTESYTRTHTRSHAHTHTHTHKHTYSHPHTHTHSHTHSHTLTHTHSHTHTHTHTHTLSLTHTHTHSPPPHTHTHTHSHTHKHTHTLTHTHTHTLSHTHTHSLPPSLILSAWVHLGLIRDGGHQKYLLLLLLLICKRASVGQLHFDKRD